MKDINKKILKIKNIQPQKMDFTGAFSCDSTWLWWTDFSNLFKYFWFNSFHVATQTTKIQIVFLSLVMPQLNVSSKSRNFASFLIRLCPIFSFLKMVLVLTLNKNIQICFFESGHATDVLTFWIYLKQTLSFPCILSLIVALINKYD